MNTRLGFRIDLPGWISDFQQQLPTHLETPEERMAAVIRLAELNVEQRSGGPFGALVVVEDSGEVVAPGVNRVEPQHCSAAHAEIVALSLAQRFMGTWNLADTRLGRLQLVTSCEPCAMCLGAIPWSGVRSLLCGATRADAEAAGFDEGERPADWCESLTRRGIQVRTALLRTQAARVLERYASGSRTIYNP